MAAPTTGRLDQAVRQLGVKVWAVVDRRPFAQLERHIVGHAGLAGKGHVEGDAESAALMPKAPVMAPP